MAISLRGSRSHGVSRCKLRPPAAPARVCPSGVGGLRGPPRVQRGGALRVGLGARGLGRRRGRRVRRVGAAVVVELEVMSVEVEVMSVEVEAAGDRDEILTCHIIWRPWLVVRC